MYKVEDVKEILEPILKQHNVKSAVLFGSVAKNTATSKSDVDILVNSGLKGIAFYGLLEDIVTKLKTKVDLIDTSQIESGSKIDQEIKNTGILIYG
ncbi:MAG: nucleotidyltransferase domain-containing protein [Lachnospiraceae bacterium]|nr:nucleotidyltransferase domain-containing protein [Lachnospiraceae bacterium]